MKIKRLLILGLISFSFTAFGINDFDANNNERLTFEIEEPQTPEPYEIQYEEHKKEFIEVLESDDFNPFAINYYLERNEMLVDLRNKKGQTALILAAQNNNKDAVETLLKKYKANPDLLDNNEEDTALMHAAKSGFNNIVKILLENNANPNIKGGGLYTALMLAAIKGHIDVINTLLAQSDIDIFATNEHEDMTALDFARRKNHKEIVQILEEAEKNSGAKRSAPEEGAGAGAGATEERPAKR